MSLWVKDPALRKVSTARRGEEPHPLRGELQRWVEARGATEAWRRVEEPEPYWSEGGPVHAERIRRSWEAGKYVALGSVVLVVWRGWDEILRYAQDDGQGKQMRDVRAGWGRVAVEVGVIRTGRGSGGKR